MRIGGYYESAKPLRRLDIVDYAFYVCVFVMLIIAIFVL